MLYMIFTLSNLTTGPFSQPISLELCKLNCEKHPTVKQPMSWILLFLIDFVVLLLHPSLHPIGFSVFDVPNSIVDVLDLICN